MKCTYLTFIYVQYDHHQNTMERALASEVSVTSCYEEEISVIIFKN